MRFISTPKYELAMNILTILNIGTVFIRTLQESSSENMIYIWIMSELIYNYLMLLETIGDIVMLGPIKAYSYHFRVWPETFCQLLNIPATIAFVQSNNSNNSQ